MPIITSILIPGLLALKLEVKKLPTKDASTKKSEEEKIAKLQTDGLLDFPAKFKYLEYLAKKPSVDALKAIYELSMIVEKKSNSGFETIKILLDRSSHSPSELQKLKPLDDKGILKTLQVIYDEDLPSNLTGHEIAAVANFFAGIMVDEWLLLQREYVGIHKKTKYDKPGGKVDGVINGYTRFLIKGIKRNGEKFDNIIKIISYAIQFGTLNKKCIAYMLCTANGEAKFVSCMEESLQTFYVYVRKSAIYYYAVIGTKASYNDVSNRTFKTQVQFSDYLIGSLVDREFIKIVNLAERQFEIGENIDYENYNLITDLFTFLSIKKSGQWKDETLNLAESEDLFRRMDAILDSSGEWVITNEILSNADFYKYAGKGLVQVTGKPNYAKIRDKIKLYIPNFAEDLERKPEKMLLPDVSCYGLVIGLKEGAYGILRKIQDHFNRPKNIWEDARQLVNSYDSYQEFAQLGKVYYKYVFRGRDNVTIV